MEVVYDRGNPLSYTFMITVLPDTVYVLVIVRCRSKMICETQNMFALLVSKVT